MKQNRKSDLRLIEFSTRKNSYPDVLVKPAFEIYQTNPHMSKSVIMRLEKLYKKLWKDYWNSFWDFVNDFRPKHCFICGKYLLVKTRSTTGVIQPYKKSDLCHTYCWQKEMKPEYITQTRLTPDSQLICHVETGKHLVSGDVCRKRIANKSGEVYAHILTHNVEVTELQFPFDYYRFLYFLKPNAKPFSKPRGYP